MKTNTCKECGEHFYGRSDKKFCDDGCRNMHNNRLNSDYSNYIRNINNILRRNRRIIERFVSENTTRVSKQLLMEHGFSFSHHTAMEITKRGKNYFYCYEYGYALQENKCLLIKKADNSVANTIILK